LQEGLVDGLKAHHLSSAKHDASHPMGDALFAIEAWVPKTKIRGLKALIADLSIECEQIAIEPFDRVPTCIENSGAGKIGEDLVQIYDTPAATDKDPSTWVVAFFSLFFAMIISDAGYGLLYLSLGLFLKWKCSQATGVLRRMIKLLLILGVTTTLWGIMSASYFGVEVGPKNSLRKLSVINYFATRKADYVVNTKGSIYREYIKLYPQAASAANGEELIAKAEVQQGGHTEYPVLTDLSNNVLMEFSLLIGIIHLSCSFARSLRRNWSGIGWILFLFGGYLYFPTSMLDATSLVEFMGLISKPVAHFVGEQMLLIGLGFVLVAAAIQHGMAAALGELLHVVQVFGDVLSYLRLYALGLAGMIVASTFNSLGSQFGIVPGVLILLAGHLLNLNLSVMSGVIHGLRLNFLEWYRYSFQGGGKNFNPLRLIRKN
jgi:V/A-type H+-transporting ATPase subunit I